MSDRCTSLRWLVLLCGLASAACVVPAGAAALPQPGFEGAFREGVAAGWVRYPIRGNVVGSFSEAREAHSGERSQLLTVDEAMDGWLQCSAAIPGGIVEGHDYEARVWVKADRAVHEAFLLVHDNSPWFPNDYAQNGRTVNQGWMELSLRFRARRTDPQAHLGVKLAQEGRLWIDDAGFRELTPEDRPPAPPGNVVRNASFEVGMAGWKGHWCEPKVVDDEAAPHGGRFLRLPGGAPTRSLQSYGLALPWGRRYTLSAYLRAERPVKVKLGLRERTRALGETEVEAGSAWKRVSLVADVPPLPDGLCFVSILPGAAVVDVDAVQVEAGEVATPFSPRAPVEAGLALEGKDAAFITGREVAGKLALFNGTPAPVDLDLRMRTRDLWERVVAEQPMHVSARPGLTEVPLALTPGRLTGAFRAEVGVGDDVRPPYAEAVFAVLPEPAAGSTPPFGTHLDFTPSTLLARCGFGWAKTWHLAWGTVEPQPGEWVFRQDGLIDSWRAAGLEVLGILSEAPAREQERPEDPLGWGWYRARDLTRMTEYARRVVEHYGDRVAAWELQNEPNHSIHPPKGQTGAQCYAREARALAEGIRAANPKARIVLGSVTLQHDPEKWLADVFAAEPKLKELCDALSIHNYNPEPAVTQRCVTRLRAMMRAEGIDKPIWDTEWSPLQSPEPFTRDTPRLYTGAHTPARRVAALTVQGMVARLGEGIEVSCLYQGYGPGDVDHSDFDIPYEITGAPSPTAVAMAVLAGQIAGSRPLGRLDLAGCWAYRFARPDGREMLVVWTRNTEPAPVDWTVPVAGRATDFMGNPIGAQPAGARLKVGAEPIYLVQDNA